MRICQAKICSIIWLTLSSTLLFAQAESEKKAPAGEDSVGVNLRQLSTSQISFDWNVHFSTSNSAAGNASEAGILTSLSYQKLLSSRFSFGAGIGLLGVKAGSNEKFLPLFTKVSYQLGNRFSGNLDLGYSLGLKAKNIIETKGGVFFQPSLRIDLTGSKSAYSSRLGIGYMLQSLSTVRRQETFERIGPSTIPDIIYRKGTLSRLVISFNHALRFKANR